MMDTSLIYESESLLDPFTVSWISNELSEYPVSYGHRASEDGETFFGRIFFWDGFREQFHQKNLPASVDYLTNFVVSWLPSVVGREYCGLRRIALNAQLPGQTGGVHVDDEEDTTLWTVLYYITDSSGDTLIYDGEEVCHSCKYKQGKFVAFPSTYVHNAEAPESGWRMSLAFGIQVQ